MHIDHQKFTDLLAEASGIEKEKIEAQLEELIEEISHAIEEDEAYEIEGFGIFSGIGNRILFIPSKELATEINFKYVGMEPIELDEEEVSNLADDTDDEAEDDDPFAGLQDFDADDEEGSSGRDPFSGLVVELDEEEIEAARKAAREKEGDAEDDEEEKPGPEEWGIDSHKEDSAGRLFSSLMGETYKEPDPEPEEEETTQEAAEEEVDPFASLMEDDDSEDSIESGEASPGGLDAELTKLMGDDAINITEDELQAGLTDGLEAPFDEIEEDDEEEEEQPEEIEETIDEAEPEPEPEAEPEKAGEEELPAAEETEDDFEDFDDPFDAIEDDEAEEDQDEFPEEIIPVITNISSDLPEPAPKAEPEKQPKKEKKPKEKKEPQPAPAWLWVVLILVVVAGGTFALGYFKIITIPGITPQTASTQPAVTPPPVQQTPTQPQQQTPPPAQTETPVTQAPAEEQPAPAEVQVVTSNQEAPSGQPKYGMKGVATEAANDGYTIVVYSLSVESNANRQKRLLEQAGYRALLTPIPSQQHGTLWRVSIGQFASLYDAAVAAEDLENPYKQNYFIKKITN